MSVGPEPDVTGGLNVLPLCVRCGGEEAPPDPTRLQEYPVLGKRPFYPPGPQCPDVQSCEEGPDPEE